jgi:hypothetical protein
MKKFGFLMFLLAIVAMLGIAAQAQYVDNTVFFTTYYSNNVAAAPDSTMRIINDGDAGPPAVGGTLYANIFVFDDSEELTQCCSCVVTPDGLLSESTKLNLTANPLRSIVNTRGVIKVVSSATPYVSPTFATETPEAGLRVWMTHIQASSVTLSPGLPVVPVEHAPYFVTETLAADSNLGPGEQASIESLCKFDFLLSGKPCTCQLEDYDF